MLEADHKFEVGNTYLNKYQNHCKVINIFKIDVMYTIAGGQALHISKTDAIHTWTHIPSTLEERTANRSFDNPDQNHPLIEWHKKLHNNFTEFREQKEAINPNEKLPSFGLEHGLTEQDIHEITLLIKNSIKIKTLDYDTPALPWIALASEVGLTYDGSFWDKLENESNWKFTATNRDLITEMFHWFESRYQAITPPTSKFTSHFTNITHPLVQAILPISYIQNLSEILARCLPSADSASFDTPILSDDVHMLNTVFAEAIEWYGLEHHFVALLKDNYIIPEIIRSHFNTSSEYSNYISDETLERISSLLDISGQYDKPGFALDKAASDLTRNLYPSTPRQKMDRLSIGPRDNAEQRARADTPITITLRASDNHEDRWEVWVTIPCLNNFLSDKTTQHLTQSSSTTIHVYGSTERRPLKFAEWSPQIFRLGEWPIKTNGLCRVDTALDNEVMLQSEIANRYLHKLSPQTFRYERFARALFKLNAPGTEARLIQSNKIRPESSYILVEPRDTASDIPGTDIHIPHVPGSDIHIADNCKAVLFHTDTLDKIPKDFINIMLNHGCEVTTRDLSESLITIEPIGLSSIQIEENYWIWPKDQNMLMAVHCQSNFTDVILTDVSGGHTISSKESGTVLHDEVSNLAYVSIPTDLVGATIYKIIVIDDGDEVVREEIIVRTVESYDPMLSCRARDKALHFTIDPIGQSPEETKLEDIWSQRATVCVLGLTSIPITFSIDLYNHQGDRLPESDRLTKTVKTVSSERSPEFYKDLFSELINELDNQSLTLSNTAEMTITLDAQIWGFQSWHFQRNIPLVKWVHTKDNIHIVSRDQSVPLLIYHLSFDQPTIEKSLDRNEYSKGQLNPIPGLYIAIYGDRYSEVDTLIVPHPNLSTIKLTTLANTISLLDPFQVLRSWEWWNTAINRHIPDAEIRRFIDIVFGDVNSLLVNHILLSLNPAEVSDMQSEWIDRVGTVNENARIPIKEYHTKFNELLQVIHPGELGNKTWREFARTLYDRAAQVADGRTSMTDAFLLIVETDLSLSPATTTDKFTAIIEWEKISTNDPRPRQMLTEFIIRLIDDNQSLREWAGESSDKVMDLIKNDILLTKLVLLCHYFVQYTYARVERNKIKGDTL